MEQWQDAASQQVRQLSSRLNEMVTRGLDVLRTELGVDLGLKPELIPPWALLLAACSGLVLMVVLWASLFRALFKKRPVPNPSDEVNELKRGLAKPVKSEEPKKKKKKAEKKAQPNGRAVAESQEEAIVPDERVPHHQPPPPETKTDKAAEASVSSSPVNRHGPQVKKSKKKAKQVAKETKSGTADGKEPEEGTWETKVSNKEKREQRKKDKNSSDGSASPGGGDSLASAPPEQTKVSAAPAPAPSQKKKKGESKQKAEKVDTAVPQVTTNSSETPAVVSAAVTKRAVKVPSHNVTPKMVPWTGNREPPSLWGGDIDESWTVIDRGMQPADLGLVSFSKLGVASESQPVNDLTWLSQPRVDDEWSGINGGAVDPSSDWNAPSEAWGNYEEPTLLQPPLVKEQTNHEQDNDEDKDNGDNSADGAAKTKKKKKKKKKAAEEGGVSGQGDVPEKKEEPAAPVKKQPPSAQEKNATVQHVKAAVEAKAERPVKEHISQKPAVTQVPQKPTDGEPTAKQNNCPAPVQQKKAEESQPPKPAKKKKVRRET
ncbi:protein LYRIC-like isoform X2 [Synchiropus splendidus]|uniref:protein LYRIC-like isoform X2 n=1 Tax=Synchiropus splendidus TaxID=270530 RepID=UPI00237E420D|nr:protein LYRIC-like isoform X2 [Synchiropus splendidus]